MGEDEGEEKTGSPGTLGQQSHSIAERFAGIKGDVADIHGKSTENDIESGRALPFAPLFSGLIHLFACKGK